MGDHARISCCAPRLFSLFHFVPTAQVMSVYMAWYPLFIQGAVERDHIMPIHPFPSHTEVKRHRAKVSSGGGPRAKSSCCAPHLFLSFLGIIGSMVQWFSTSDFESGDPGSNPGRAYFMITTFTFALKTSTFGSMVQWFSTSDFGWGTGFEPR